MMPLQRPPESCHAGVFAVLVMFLFVLLGLIAAGRDLMHTVPAALLDLLLIGKVALP